MKLTAKIKLVYEEEAGGSLFRTVALANACCEWLSEQAWSVKKFRKYDLQKLFYYGAREAFSDLSAQCIIRCIAKVANSYKLDKKTQRSFAPLGAIAYDLRILSWKQGIVSIWTVDGRKKIPYVCGERQAELLKTQHGETDLLLQDGQFYLATCCDVAEPEINTLNYHPPLGVDFGVVNIATDSDGTVYSGSRLKNIRFRHRRLRTALQKANTKSAERHLRKLSGKEARFARDTNHVISKQIVRLAKGTCRGIAVEDLSGIRDRITVRRKQRAVLHSWSFLQLRSFLEYKSALAGVPIVAIDPRNTSRQCSECGHIDKRNRKTQDKFVCLNCGHAEMADLNAARVIASRVNVSRPIVPSPAAASPCLQAWGG